MSWPKLRWPQRLADVPDFPPALVAPLAAHGMRTVSDLVARIKRDNPGLLPPSSAYYMHLRLNSFPLTTEAPELCSRGMSALVNWLDYPSHMTPQNWTDPPNKKSRPEPETESPMKIEYVKPQSLELHPEASLVPEMSADQYKEFLADVKRMGKIEEPLKRIKGTNTVIDGRTRRRAAIDAGFAQIPVVDADLDGDDDPVVYMLRVAQVRRHLTSGQRAALGAIYLQRLKKAAKQRQKEGAKKGGETAGKGRAKEPDSLVADRPQGKAAPAPKSRDEAARLSGSSPKAVETAAKVAEKSPETFAKLSAGEITLPEAKRVISPPKSPLADLKPSDFTTKSEPTQTLNICADLHELNPCPFCGAKGDHLKNLGGHSVICHNCGAAGPNKSTEQAARTAWNKRIKK